VQVMAKYRLCATHAAERVLSHDLTRKSTTRRLEPPSWTSKVCMGVSIYPSIYLSIYLSMHASYESRIEVHVHASPSRIYNHTHVEFDM
jgi:hypothetical protein